VLIQYEYCVAVADVPDEDVEVVPVAIAVSDGLGLGGGGGCLTAAFNVVQDAICGIQQRRQSMKAQD
jgi:hypothetical protein